ncbi:hypothetical protein [Methylobacterium indicum]|uniref:hypothetical protein n=1 Tax=Methylobacterium indicum TaxID=1775910 RepID=UPI000AD48D8B|nr:hypothetical protein [Methylobacterium indicum]
MSISQIARTAIAAGTLLSMLAGASAAHAATLKWTITNQFGSTITLDRASCSSGTYVSAPFSISSGSTVTVRATTSGSSDLCNLRYQSGVYGCQFQVQASAYGAFASANAYKGAGSSPNCPYTDNSQTGAGSGTFRFTR